MSSFRRSRLRAPEWIVGAASLALIVILFALPWYGITSVFAPTASTLGVRVSSTGWQSLPALRILIVIVCLVGLAAWWLQGSRAAPALPVCATAITMVLSLATFVWLIDRVLFNVPGNLGGGPAFIGVKAGGYLGLALSAVLFGACYWSLRIDGVAAQDTPRDIETLRLAPGRR